MHGVNIIYIYLWVVYTNDMMNNGVWSKYDDMWMSDQMGIDRCIYMCVCVFYCVCQEHDLKHGQCVDVNVHRYIRTDVREYK